MCDWDFEWMSVISSWRSYSQFQSNSDTVWLRGALHTHCWHSCKSNRHSHGSPPPSPMKLPWWQASICNTHFCLRVARASREGAACLIDAPLFIIRLLLWIKWQV